MAWFPLTGIHANALDGAQAGRCAADQEAFWPMHDLLFERQREWADDPNETHLATVQQAEARQLGIQATPPVLVNGQPVEFTTIAAATNELRASIDAPLALQCDRIRSSALPPTLLLAASLGLALSVYFTFLHLFVRRAICVWCVGSAVIELAIWIESWQRTDQIIPGSSRRWQGQQG